MPEPKNVKAAEPATPAKKAEVPSATPAQVTQADIEKEQKRAQDEATKIEAEAAEKAGKINAGLIRNGDPRRVQGGVRAGKPVFFWGNFVPTQAMTEEDQKAAEKV